MPNLIGIRLTDRKSYVMGFEPPVVNAVGCHEKLVVLLNPTLFTPCAWTWVHSEEVKMKSKKLSEN
jgi:hypothetical protein